MSPVISGWDRLRRTPGRTDHWLSPAVAAIAAATIFALDTLSEFQVDVGVLYVIVVLLCARFLRARGIALVAAGCIGLTLLSAALTPPIDERALIHGLENIGIALTVIVLTTVIVVQGQATNMKLHERADLLDLTYDAVFACGLNHVITYWNHGAETLYGWTAAEAVGRATDELLGTIYPANPGDLDAQLLRTGHWEGELVTHKRDGTRTYVATRWLLQRDEREQHPVAILKTNTDITVQKQTQESLQQAEATLVRLNRVLLVGEMTASIAHEINQPLTGVVANSGTALRWLSAQPPELDEVRHYLRLIQSDGRRASEVISRIRGLFRRAPPSIGPLDLNDALGEVCSMTSSDLQKHAIALRTDLAADRPLVAADRVQLQQVILNLVVNAVEAMQDVDDRPRKLELVTGHSEACQVFVEVRDSGPGVNPANLDAVFDSFYTTKPGGMGMGLSISRSIVEAHGGQLSAAANAPYGAVFRLTLPIATEQAHYDTDGTAADGLHR